MISIRQVGYELSELKKRLCSIDDSCLPKTFKEEFNRFRNNYIDQQIEHYSSSATLSNPHKKCPNWVKDILKSDADGNLCRRIENYSNNQKVDRLIKEKEKEYLKEYLEVVPAFAKLSFDSMWSWRYKKHFKDSFFLNDTRCLILEIVNSQNRYSFETWTNRPLFLERRNEETMIKEFVIMIDQDARKSAYETLNRRIEEIDERDREVNEKEKELIGLRYRTEKKERELESEAESIIKKAKKKAKKFVKEKESQMEAIINAEKMKASKEASDKAYNDILDKSEELIELEVKIRLQKALIKYGIEL
jgi:hypothetical protein